MDVKNGVNKYIHQKRESNFTYKAVFSAKEFFEECDSDYWFNTNDDIAFDLETEGFDFLEDRIWSISFSSDSGTVVMPLDHWEIEHTPQERADKYAIAEHILCSKNNRKVAQNCKFDLKFLRREGIVPHNVWDTKTMAYLNREDAPSGLSDLVKEYFPEELEDL
jgi:DNA polymerase I-like protein with 3'-5' exonuclease and polymerase domains